MRLTSPYCNSPGHVCTRHTDRITLTRGQHVSYLHSESCIKIAFFPQPLPQCISRQALVLLHFCFQKANIIYQSLYSLIQTGPKEQVVCTTRWVFFCTIEKNDPHWPLKNALLFRKALKSPLLYITVSEPNMNCSWASLHGLSIDKAISVKAQRSKIIIWPNLSLLLCFIQFVIIYFILELQQTPTYKNTVFAARQWNGLVYLTVRRLWVWSLTKFLNELKYVFNSIYRNKSDHRQLDSASIPSLFNL